MIHAIARFIVRTHSLVLFDARRNPLYSGFLRASFLSTEGKLGYNHSIPPAQAALVRSHVFLRCIAPTCLAIDAG